MTKEKIYEAYENTINNGGVLDLIENPDDFFIDEVLTEAVDTEHENTEDYTAIGAVLVRDTDDEFKVMVARDGSHFEDYYSMEDFVKAFGE